MQNLEMQVIRLIQSAGDWLESPMRALTWLGSLWFYLLVMPAVYWCYDTGLGMQLGWMLALSTGLNQALKLFFHRPRPYWLSDWSGIVRALASARDFAFPSGHAQHAVSVWGLVPHSLLRRWTRPAVVCLAFAIGLSRVYLGVHFPTDVLGGWVIGGLLLVAFLRWRGPLGRRLAALGFHQQIATALGLSLGMLGLNLLGWLGQRGWQMPQSWSQTALAVTGQPIDPLSMANAFDVSGLLLGIGGGAAWLARAGGLSTAGSLGKRVVRYGVGLLGLGALWFGLKAILPGGDHILAWSLSGLASAMAGLWVTAGAPLVFRRLGLAVRSESPLGG